MAAFAKTQIVGTPDVYVLTCTPKLRFATVVADLSTQGGDGANTIGAAALGFSKLLMVGNVYDPTGDKILLAACDDDNLFIADDLTDGDIADVSLTAARFSVLGLPL